MNRARIVINRNNQRISLLEFRKTLEQNLADIEKAYWQQVDAEGEVKIAEELLNRTLATGKDPARRVHAGRRPRADVAGDILPRKPPHRC